MLDRVDASAASGAEIAGERGAGKPARSYISGIDGLRAVAVLAVLLYHVDHRLLPGGFAGVDLFFVISGFVVSFATSELRRERFGGLVLAFYRRRIVRIVPAALTFLIVTQLAAVLFIPVVDKVVTSDRTAAAAAAGFGNLVLWKGASDYFSPATALNPFTHTWSLGVEEQFYFTFPFLAALVWLWGRRRTGLLAIAAAAAVSLLAAALLTAHRETFAFYMLPTRFWELAAGVLLFLAVERRAAPDALGPSSASAWAAAGLGVLLLGWTLAFATPARFPFPLALPAVAGAALVIHVVARAPRAPLSRLLSVAPARHLGRISYSLYLWHWGVIVLMEWTVGLSTPLQKAAAVLASLFLAELSYRFVERPWRASPWLARRTDGQVVAGGVAAVGLGVAAILALTAARPLLSRSTTKNAQTWSPVAQGVGGRCGVVQGRAELGRAGTRYSFTPRACRGPADPRRLIMVGDSHAWAYQRLAGNLARQQGIASAIYRQTGCAVLPVNRSSRSADRACASYVDAALAAARKEARPGDVLFLPGLRSARYRNYWESGFAPDAPPVAYTPEAVAQEAARLRPFLDAGVRVVLEAPKPVYKYAPFRCADAFTRANPHCAVPPLSRAEAEGRREGALRLFAALRALEPRIEVWDPFPTLCPGSVCPAVRDGEPLTDDGDHLAPYGQDLLTPDFLRMLGRPGEAAPASDAARPAQAAASRPPRAA